MYKDLINEQWCRELLKKEDLDYNKFYKRQIEVFLDVSRKDNKILTEKITRAIELIHKAMQDVDIKGNKSLNLTDLLDVLESKGE